VTDSVSQVEATLNNKQEMSSAQSSVSVESLPVAEEHDESDAMFPDTQIDLQHVSGSK